MKEIILGIFFITGGISFIVSGFYFRSKKYLDALCTGIYDSAKLKSKKLFATATGIFSTAIGILTVMSGILFFALPEMKYEVALFYIIVFALLSIVYMFVFSRRAK